MPGPIQTIPQGLLGLLQLKELGQNPTEFLLTVQPTVDQTPFWMARTMVEIPTASSVNVASGATGFHNVLAGGVNLAVPQNETWYVDACGVFVNLVPAPDSPIGVAAAYTNPGGGMYTLTPLGSDVISARARSFSTSPMPRPVFLPPGAFLGVFLSDTLTSTSITFTLFMRMARLLI